MKVKIDKSAGAMFIQFGELRDGEFVKPAFDDSANIIPNYKEDGTLFGIEILNLTKIDKEELESCEITRYE